MRTLALETEECLQGVYSGVVNSQNGNVNDVANINRTSLRGVQPTDANGVVQFNTLVPGHYVGRANHVHGKHASSFFGSLRFEIASHSTYMWN